MHMTLERQRRHYEVGRPTKDRIPTSWIDPGTGGWSRVMSREFFCLGELAGDGTLLRVSRAIFARIRQVKNRHHTYTYECSFAARLAGGWSFRGASGSGDHFSTL